MFENLLINFSSFIWSMPTLCFFVIVHLFLTYKTGFVQKKLFQGIRLSFSKEKKIDNTGEISQFAALSTALASTMGTGNIIGVGTTIALGGAGAVFWCWITGIFGMATKYAETYIAVKYREESTDKKFVGGAMYVLKNRLNKKKLAWFFAFFTILCSFGIGAAVQANAIAHVTYENLKISPWVLGIILSILTALVIFAGVRGIAKVCEMAVPIMSIFYILGCLIILIINRFYLIQSIVVILKSAFDFRSFGVGVSGGMFLNAVRYGVSRGLFTNEAGMGSTPMVSAAAKSKNAHETALVAQTAVFWDTVVVCLITALCMVSYILKNNKSFSDLGDGGLLAYDVFCEIPYIGKFILTISVIAFAFATILGWAYYGECAFSFLFGKKMIELFRIMWILVVLISPSLPLNLVWLASDILNALMTFPNLYAVLKLSNELEQ